MWRTDVSVELRREMTRREVWRAYLEQARLSEHEEVMAKKVQVMMKATEVVEQSPFNSVYLIIQASLPVWKLLDMQQHCFHR